MSVGQRIKIAREGKDMTLEEVAKKCETTKQTIFKYENEIVTNIPYDKLVLLCKALDVSPAYLFGWDEKKVSPNEPPLDEEDKKMLKLFRQIPKERRGSALEVLEALLKMQKIL